MPEITTDRLQIAYDGQALREGRMPMEALAVGLRGQALLIKRTCEIVLGESEVSVLIDPDFEAGSLVVPVHIVTHGLQTAQRVLTSPAVTAVANLMQLLGFGGISGASIYGLFRRLHGRKIDKPEDVLTQQGDLNVSVDLVLQLYNDAEVHKQLRKTVDPLRLDGIEEFQTRRQGRVVETLSKRDLQAIDEAELEDLTRDEEVVLDIEKTAWRRSLMWHFSDGRTSFDAKIEDDNFWLEIENGESYSEGDQMRVHLKTTARRTRRGSIKVERTIPKVLGVDHVRRRQSRMFPDERAQQ